MTSNQQDDSTKDEDLTFREPASNLNGDEIVITGISGIFPKSNNVEEFMNNLYNKVDMVTINEEEGQFVHPEMPKYYGRAQGFNMFDAQFFRVPHGQAEYMDPMIRKILENAYGVLFDAGVSPITMSGTKLGVYVGCAYNDVVSIAMYTGSKNCKYWISGCLKSMQANRITYWINSHGPSYCIDSSCSSSMTALQNAFWAIKTGECDSAIVAGSNHIIDPMLTLNLRRKGLLTLSSKTKCFDNNADGYVRSEAVSVIFLQRARDAKRIYAEVIYVKEKYMMDPDTHFLPIRKTDDLENLLRQFYSEIKMSPNIIEYVEAYGAGIVNGDANELEAISRVFGKEKPVKVGCVKSNMGNCGGAADVTAIIKACLAYHKGEIPGNLHYDTPQENIAGVRNGKIQIVTENIPFKRGYIALNSFALTGMTHHALIKGHYKKKMLEQYHSSIPRLVLASGRIESSIFKIFDTLKSQSIDAEQIALLHDFFANDISGHTYRGYTILDTNEKNETISLAESANHYPGVTRPVWFMYSGMGSQWTGMGAELMKIPTFAASIERCQQILEPRDINIFKILTDNDEKFDNILHSFVGIAAMQIGLTDLLKEMGIVPDNIIGHSLGEHGCAYADGCLTDEETMLTSYYRGLVSIQMNFIDGLMAAVGLGHEQISLLCPPEIEVACHNSSDSSTISGPAEAVKKFVQELKNKGIFAKAVNTGNIAYHSKYIAEAGPNLLPNLSKVITSPKLRSAKWICTSAPKKCWAQNDVKYASAEYFTNNLLNVVYFHEAARNIPDNAIIIEISPHGLMQAILRRSHKTNVNIPLTNRHSSDPVNFLLEAVGKLYEVGLNPKIDFMYPKVQYPVSTETPMLSQLVGWAHDVNWPPITFNKKKGKRMSSRNFAMILDDDDWKYLQGHMRNGAVIFPEMALLFLVWETLAMYKDLNYRNVSVLFEAVQFHKELYLKKDETLRFTISLQMGNGRFEICAEDVIIVNGTVIHIMKPERTFPEVKIDNNEDVILTFKDIYLLFEIKGYSFKDEFQSILSTTTKYNKGVMKWTQNWVTFLDSLLQFLILLRDHDGILVPKYFRKLTIDTTLHNRTNRIFVDDNICLDAVYDKMLSMIKCGGVTIVDVTFSTKPSPYKIIDIENMSFIPHMCTDIIDINQALRINMQIVFENMTGKHLKIIEIISDNKTNTISNKIKYLCATVFNITVEMHYLKDININKIKKLNNANDGTTIIMFVTNGIPKDKKEACDYYDILASSPNTFILSVENEIFKDKVIDTKLCKVITCMQLEMDEIMVLRRNAPNSDASYIVLDEIDNSHWMSHVKNELDMNEKLVLVSEKYNRGLIDFVKALRKKGYTQVRLIMVNDIEIRKFTAKQMLYEQQMETDLVYNIFKKGVWGDYYYLPVSKQTEEIRNVALVGNFATCLGTWAEYEINQHANNLIQVSYAGPTLYDYQNILSGDSDDKKIGMDFSGYNDRGDRVMGLVAGGALASRVDADVTLTWPVPQEWSLEDAATVPLPYAMAYYCLAMKSRLLRNNTVLVLGGAGALGQAVINLSLALNCTVFTTVSHYEKKQFLLRTFPNLEESNIICFTPGLDDIYTVVVQRTKKSLCDIVISCAIGELREEAMKCVGSVGYFININNHSDVDNFDLGMSFYSNERSYRQITFSNIFRPENLKERKSIHRLISEGISQGSVKPLTRTVFSPSECSKSFRFLSSNQRTGRVLIKMEDKTDIKKLNILTRVSFNAEGSYLIVGCESFLGIELADWLVKRGAKKVVLHQRNNIGTSYLYARRVSWKKYGVLSAVSTDDLSKYEHCNSLLDECEKLGPVLGIFIFQDMTNASIKVLEPEQSVESNLDIASRNKCKYLRNFVIISGDKHIGGKYILNSVCEHICEKRNDDLLPSLMMYTDVISDKTADSGDTIAEKIFKLLNTLETSIKHKCSNVTSTDVKKHGKTDFLKNIVDILGTIGNGILDESKALNSFNINELYLNEIRILINKTFKVDFTKQELKGFTFARLKNMCKNTEETKINMEGLRVFFNFIDNDEIQASEPLVKMPSKIGGCVNMLLPAAPPARKSVINIEDFQGNNVICHVTRERGRTGYKLSVSCFGACLPTKFQPFLSYATVDEYDSKEAHLIMIPGFEGHSRIFSSIGERLKIQAVTLQLPPDLEGNSIQEMAKALLKHIKKTFEFGTKFYILGYSFGVNIALEIAALLEDEGYVGVVYCLDSSPDSVRILLDAYLGKLTTAELQNHVAQDIFHLMTGDTCKILDEELEKCNDWPKKVDVVLNKLQTLVSYSQEYRRAILNSAYQRIMLAREYEPKFKLKSEVVLMRGISHPKAEELTEDYNLYKYTIKPVQVFNIESDHQSAPYYCGVSNIVNKMLDPFLLEEYKTKNLCEAYFEEDMKTETKGIIKNEGYY